MDYPPIKRIVPQTAGVSARLLLLLLIRGAGERTRGGKQGVGIYLLPQQPFVPSLPDPSSPIRAHRGWVGPCWSCSPRRGGSEAGKRVLRGHENTFSRSKASGIHLHPGMNSCNGTQTQMGKKGSAACGKQRPAPNPTSHLLSTGTRKERKEKEKGIIYLLLPKLQVPPHTPQGAARGESQLCLQGCPPARAAPSFPSLLPISAFFFYVVFYHFCVPAQPAATSPLPASLDLSEHPPRGRSCAGGEGSGLRALPAGHLLLNPPLLPKRKGLGLKTLQMF